MHASGFSCLKYFANPQISAGFWGWMALICQTKEEQLEQAARLIWRWKGLCPAPKGADDAQAGVFLVSCFIYKTQSATISLQQQNLWILPVPLRNLARSSGLAAAPEPPASPWGSPRTQTLCRNWMKPYSQPASSRFPAGDFMGVSCTSEPGLDFHQARWFPSLNSWSPSEISPQQQLSTPMTSLSQAC